ncbi:hypothetical protein OVA29_12110 [Exiguobacterium sp. SL14]|nr:hypothetical protein [Exiguobacterium sp. SL14]MCY1691338.1 hypothetical protein [Exiguobacterium sp. SL14]
MFGEYVYTTEFGPLWIGVPITMGPKHGFLSSELATLSPGFFLFGTVLFYSFRFLQSG